jgi:hypothetical protein
MSRRGGRGKIEKGIKRSAREARREVRKCAQEPQDALVTVLSSFLRVVNELAIGKGLRLMKMAEGVTRAEELPGGLLCSDEG